MTFYHHCDILSWRICPALPTSRPPTLSLPPSSLSLYLCILNSPPVFHMIPLFPQELAVFSKLLKTWLAISNAHHTTPFARQVRWTHIHTMLAIYDKFVWDIVISWQDSSNLCAKLRARTTELKKKFTEGVSEYCLKHLDIMMESFCKSTMIFPWSQETAGNFINALS